MVDYVANATHVKRAWELSGRYVGAAIAEHAGRDFADIVQGLVPSMLLAAGAVMTTTAVGAAVGAGLGALAGGVGAAPGAVAGGSLGLSIGLGILEWLGLGVLAVYIGSGLADVAKDLDAGAQMAWTSGGSATQIDAAARRMAGAVGRLFSLVLQGIVADVSARGMAAATKQLAASRLGASLQNVFRTDAFEQALGKHILEQTKPLPNGESALGRFNAPPVVQRRAGKAAQFYSKHEASIRNEYITNVVDFLKTIDLSREVQSGSDVLRVGDEVVRYRVGTHDNPATALFATRPGTSPTDLALSWQGRTRVRYRVKAPPPDVLQTTITGLRLGKPGSRFTGHFSDSSISGGTGTQYVIPNWSTYLEEIKPFSSSRRR